jgi:RNA-binding protein NOB1
MSTYCGALRSPEPAASGASCVPFTRREGERVAVVDANAVIRGVRLEGVADAAVTVPEVLAEVRDAQSRAALAALPLGLWTRTAEAEALAAVRRFALLTGDASVLSTVDCKLLALALALEWEAHGRDHLRSKPPLPTAVKRAGRNPTPLPGWDFVANPADWEPLDREEEAAAAAAAAGQPAPEEETCAASRIALHGMEALALSDEAAAHQVRALNCVTRARREPQLTTPRGRLLRRQEMEARTKVTLRRMKRPAAGRMPSAAPRATGEPSAPSTPRHALRRQRQRPSGAVQQVRQTLSRPRRTRRTMRRRRRRTRHRQLVPAQFRSSPLTLRCRTWRYRWG